MLIELIRGRGDTGEQAFVPLGYRKTVKWLPQIGDLFPNFQATTTEGPLRFVDWVQGHWCFLFSHPAAFTPVCTTEMVSLAAAKTDFDQRNVKLLGFTASPLADQRKWHKDIFEKFGFSIDFPTISDPNGTLASAFGMIHERESSIWPIRKSFIIDPQMRIRMITEYPIYVGRSTDEVLRTIDALQAVDQHDVAIAADWTPGEEYLCLERHDPSLDHAIYGDRLQRLTPYLSLITPE